MTLVDRAVLLRLRGATEEAAKRALVAEVERQLARAKAESDPSGIRQFVDGVEDRPIAVVKAGGIVHFEFFYTREIVEVALALLDDTSPIDSGSYVERHAVYVDGNKVDDLAAIETAERIVISNTIAYARVIERGRGKRVPWSKQPQVPRDGVYTSAARAMARRFGNVANVRFGWVGVDEKAETGSTASKDRFPAIIIERR